MVSLSCRWRPVVVLAVATGACTPAAAEQLPIRTLTTADGLPHDRVKCIVSDSHGYLWLCTQEGLSRYDGEQLHGYRTTDGLPQASINDVLETREGEYWIAFNRVGLARFHPERRGGSRFEVPSMPNAASRQVNALLQDRQGTVWAATTGGLLRVDREGRVVETDLSPLPAHRPVWAMAEDAEGALWLGTVSGLARRSRDGRTFPVAVAGKNEGIISLAVDTRARVWIGTVQGIIVIAPGQAGRALESRRGPLPPESPGVAVALTGTGLEGEAVNAIRCGGDGVVRAAGNAGLVEFPEGHPRALPGVHGVLSLGEDAAGNVWFGTANGARRLARGGFVTYGAEDGLRNTDVEALEEDDSGALLVATRDWLLHRWGGTRFAALRFNIPTAIRHRTESWYPVPLRDHLGDWWVPTAQGLFRFARTRRFEDLAHAAPRRYTAAEGLAADGVYRVFEDRRGDVWFAHHPGGAGVVTRWRRADGAFLRVSEGLPPTAEPVALGQDATGSVWVGFLDGGLAREVGGRFQAFGVAEGAPSGIIRAIHSDGQGRLWVTSNDGVIARIDRPGEAHPRIVVDAAATAAVAGGAAFGIAEDGYGREYVGIGRGVLRLDGARGQATVFTSLDGLPHGSVRAVRADGGRAGPLWFGATAGLARLAPEPPADEPDPRIVITSVQAAGDMLPISELGVADVPAFTLRPDAGQVEVEFVSVSFAPGQAVRYEYRLEGADARWHEPSPERRLRFAHLAPGRYRFLVRAVAAGGRVSQRPATMSFVVLQPAWKRPWFVLAAALALAGVAYAVYRGRLAHLLAMERVRTRIATDLHDDLGSSLSRVAILSEVAKRQVDGHAEARAMLDDIGSTARSLIDATSDIIWAIDPRRDAVGPLAARVREFAGGLFGGGRAIVRVHAEPEVEHVPLDPVGRRHLYLILKEALNNAARHAHCREVSVRLAVQGRRLVAEVADDGCGFSPGDASDAGGRGLASMRERAAALGGRLVVESTPGRGTVLHMEVPL